MENYRQNRNPEPPLPAAAAQGVRRSLHGHKATLRPGLLRASGLHKKEFRVYA